MLCIEEVDEKYDNHKQRVHRKNFYLRNGLQEMGFKYVEKGVKYEMLYVGEKLSSKVYDELMLYYCGNIYHNIVIIKMMNFLIKHPVGCFFIWLYNKENRRKKECYTKN